MALQFPPCRQAASEGRDICSRAWLPWGCGRPAGRRRRGLA